VDSQPANVGLIRRPNFWLYLLNTLYLMLGIPLAIGGSLIPGDAAALSSRRDRVSHASSADVHRRRGMTPDVEGDVESRFRP
jgi:hypothetical protein